MKEIYRINYVVDKNGTNCTIYTYPILDEKKTYFLIRSGLNNRHIKKDIIGEIRHTDINRTGFYVFLTELENKDMYIDAMIQKVKDNALNNIDKFKSICNNAVRCDIKMVNVEPE